MSSREGPGKARDNNNRRTETTRDHKKSLGRNKTQTKVAFEATITYIWPIPGEWDDGREGRYLYDYSSYVLGGGGGGGELNGSPILN